MIRVPANLYDSSTSHTIFKNDKVLQIKIIKWNKSVRWWHNFFVKKKKMPLFFFSYIFGSKKYQKIVCNFFFKNCYSFFFFFGKKKTAILRTFGQNSQPHIRFKNCCYFLSWRLKFMIICECGEVFFRNGLTFVKLQYIVMNWKHMSSSTFEKLA